MNSSTEPTSLHLNRSRWLHGAGTSHYLSTLSVASTCFCASPCHCDAARPPRLVVSTSQCLVSHGRLLHHAMHHRHCSLAAARRLQRLGSATARWNMAHSCHSIVPAAAVPVWSASGSRNYHQCASSQFPLHHITYCQNTARGPTRGSRWLLPSVQCRPCSRLVIVVVVSPPSL